MSARSLRRPIAQDLRGRDPRPVHADGVALMLAVVLGVATLATLFRFFQFVAWA